MIGTSHSSKFRKNISFFLSREAEEVFHLPFEKGGKESFAFLQKSLRHDPKGVRAALSILQGQECSTKTSYQNIFTIELFFIAQKQAVLFHVFDQLRDFVKKINQEEWVVSFDYVKEQQTYKAPYWRGSLTFNLHTFEKKRP